ncbi:MAG: CCA tRNA nucleotidyltransferase [Clostridia bacterium]|nr:CCA tRNA nucleotidyltransferase [Clostridia bacterium]
MRTILPENLLRLAELCPTPLYLVGGSVRDFLLGKGKAKLDLDICAPLPPEKLAECAGACGFSVRSVYKNTGTVKLTDGQGNELEYAAFRSDKYVRGEHTPREIFFTDDISLDAKRRDFTMNAVYYDIRNGKFVDPLGGIAAIQEKRISTVREATRVFGEDGLRLMRLARQAAQLGFTPDQDCLAGATENAELILDITPERIYAELLQILSADRAYGNEGGHYQGLLLLEKTGVLSKILPELTLGKGMAQRADFHDYDVLFHSLRAVLYATQEVRLAALLHDIGKPFCTLRDGNSHAHPTEGAELAESVLNRLKAPKKTIAQIKELVFWHMYDFDCKTGESKLRRFLVAHAPLLPALMQVKQADYSGCKDDPSPCPTNVKWQKLLEKMHAEKVPFSLKDLRVTGKDLIDKGVPAPRVSEILNKLLSQIALIPKDNEKSKLLKLALQFSKT